MRRADARDDRGMTPATRRWLRLCAAKIPLGMIGRRRQELRRAVKAALRAEIRGRG